MSEVANLTFLIIFTIFTIMMIIIAIFIRKMSVDDVFDKSKSPFFIEKSSVFSGQIKQSKPSSLSQQGKKDFNLDRKMLNNIGKILMTIGAILIFVPLPDPFNGFGIPIAFIGYILNKATADLKKKASTNVQNARAQKVRLLSGKPEYQEALKLLYNDYSENPQATEEEKYRRALTYLQKQGISQVEARENLKLLFPLLRIKKSQVIS